MTHGISSCPSFTKDTPEFMIPTDVELELSVEVENLPRPHASHAGYSCLVTVEGARMELEAVLDDGKYITCQKTVVSP